MQLSDNNKLIIQQFFTGQPVKRAYLFGSYARAEADKDSDIDILVELDYSKHIGLGFVQMQLDLEKMLQKKVDLVSAKGLSPHIYPFIEQDKQLIYAK
jgi:predicted nucleotidyltransferase